MSTMPPLPEPDAWLCWMAEEDGSTRTMIVDEDPDGLRFNDIGEPSPFRVTPLHSVEQMHAYAEQYAAPLVEALEALRLAREQDKYPSWEKGIPEFQKAEALADAAIAAATGEQA